MNRAKIYIFLLLLSFACIPLQAQPKAHISLNSQTISRQGNNLDIALVLQAKDIHLHSDQSLRLELALESTEKRLVLPCVIYTGNKRYKYDRRSELLSGQPQFPQGAIYETIRPIDKNKTYTLDYDLAIPYEAWMDHASINAVQVFHDCCNESEIEEQILLADMGIVSEPRRPQPEVPALPLITETPAVWTPDKSLCGRMVSLLTAPKETTKERSSAIEVQIDYPQNVYKVLPTFGKNAQQLGKVHDFMGSVMNNELITLNHILITGYASPEGTYKANDLLASNRANGFKQYIIGRYNLSNFPIDTESVAEDWDGLVRLLNEKKPTYAPDALTLINTYGIFEGREKNLMDMQGGIPYRSMLKDLFPLLRRIELEADYVVADISEAKAKELLYTQPALLSLDEMYRVANNYTPGTPDYQKVYEIAAKTYPNDALANNNAVAACLMNSDTTSALLYLNKLGANRIGHINRGVYHYMLGDKQQAEKYFQLATQWEETKKQADMNLGLIAP